MFVIKVHTIDGIWRILLSLVALVFFSVIASFLLDGEYKDSAIKVIVTRVHFVRGLRRHDV